MFSDEELEKVVKQIADASGIGDDRKNVLFGNMSKVRKYIGMMNEKDIKKILDLSENEEIKEFLEDNNLK